MDIIFSAHAVERMAKRNIYRVDAALAIRFPDITIKKHNKYFFRKRLQRGEIEVCSVKMGNKIKVVTVYWIK